MEVAKVEGGRRCFEVEKAIQRYQDIKMEGYLFGETAPDSPSESREGMRIGLTRMIRSGGTHTVTVFDG